MKIINTSEQKIKYYELILEKNTLDDIGDFPLPDGYAFTLYKEGDLNAWLRILKQSGEIITRSEGSEAFQCLYDNNSGILADRLFFIENAAGEKIATATASASIKCPNCGWLEWVSVARPYQGKGLARPLIACALRKLKDLGFASVRIPTQTTSWLALKLYFDFGFTPEADNAKESEYGYGIAKSILKHPSLARFPDIAMSDIWNEVIVKVENLCYTLYPDISYIKIWQEMGNFLIFESQNRLYRAEYRVDKDAPHIYNVTVLPDNEIIQL